MRNVSDQLMMQGQSAHYADTALALMQAGASRNNCIINVSDSINPVFIIFPIYNFMTFYYNKNCVNSKGFLLDFFFFTLNHKNNQAVFFSNHLLFWLINCNLFSLITDSYPMLHQAKKQNSPSSFSLKFRLPINLFLNHWISKLLVPFNHKINHKRYILSWRFL